MPILGIVENMSYFIAPDTHVRYDIFGSGGALKLCKKYNIPLLGEIPLNSDILKLSDDGKMAVVFGSDEIKKCYQEVVEELLKFS